MCDLGATVIKVEVNSHLDSVRGPAVPAPSGAIGNYANNDPGDEPWNRNGYFNKLNRGKFDVCMNILADEGRAVLHELIARADVVVENFGGGVFERMGYGYEVLKNLNEDVVFISMPPSGNGGPEANYVGYGVAIEQLGGIVDRTGYEGDTPMKTGINYGDPIAGVHAMGYIMTALHHRQNTGRGSYIDLSQREAAICWLGDEVVEYELTGREPARIGNRDEFMAPLRRLPLRRRRRLGRPRHRQPRGVACPRNRHRPPRPRRGPEPLDALRPPCAPRRNRRRHRRLDPGTPGQCRNVPAPVSRSLRRRRR